VGWFSLGITTMDSLPTGATQSWLLVLAAALSPVITLFIADVIGRVRQRKATSGAPVGSPAGSVSHLSMTC
jgi:hypothetical protein